MSIRLSDDCSEVDWDALALVFKRASLGERTPEKLRDAFTNSCFWPWRGARRPAVSRCDLSRRVFAR